MSDISDPYTSELEGRVAIVTGASRNIGRAIAQELAAAGAAVIINSHTAKAEAETVAAEIEANGGKAMAFLADVTDPKAVAAMVAAALACFGRLDILVNNAAVRKEAAFDQISLNDWRQILSIVLDGAFLCAQASLPAMMRAGGGAIVNIGGLTGHTGARRRAHVITAKAGVAGLTKALAFDLAAHNITVNCVSPGLIDTTRAGGTPARHAEHKTAVGRLGQPADVATMVRMLCGPRARYITGQTIHVNGGVFMG